MQLDERISFFQKIPSLWYKYVSLRLTATQQQSRQLRLQDKMHFIAV